MSKTIDQRVVEMRFDNRDFESNVKTSMSTLDKLKQALNLQGASKGLESVSSAAKKVDFSGMSSGIETVQAKFSALQVVGMTALSNITTAAMNAGKNLVSSFTIAPITDGFREYETQMNSVQTILANTASKGTTINDVTAALDELNTYADQTIYNFSEMTRNIGTFTAAGVDLDKSVAAIKGIANLGAMSGSSSMQVSTAMYQLSQALAAGKVSLMDWNSVVNAGMGGEQFQNALKRTAENMGTNVDALIKKYGSFRESLTKGEWLTSEVLIETLNQFTMAAEEGSAEWDKFKKSLMEKGYTEEQAVEILNLANTATDAATKVKTFTQLMDTMKEAAGSGWAKTWQILLGDFEEAKEFFTGLSDYFGEMIGASADARNNLLSGAMDSNWTKLGREIEKAGVPLDTFTDKLKAVAKEHNVDIDAMVAKQGSLAKVMESGSVAGSIVIETLQRFAGTSKDLNKSTEAMTDKLEYFQKVVNDVWRGDYKNVDTGRIELLEKAGYDYAQVQDLVNKTIDGQKLTLEDLSDAQLKSVGYTEEQVTAIRKLAEEANKSGTSINELIRNLNKPSGRVLFLDTISNTIKAILEPLRAVKRAFNEVFAVNSDQVYGIIEALNRFSEAILMDEESLDKLTRTFKGIFGIVKIFTSLLGGGFGLAFNILTGVLENFNIGLLDTTAFIGDILYAFSDWITSGDLVAKAISGIGSVLQWAFGWASDFVGELSKFPAIQGAITSISNFFSTIFDYFSKLSSLDPSEAIKKVVEDIKNLFANLTWEDVIAGLTTFGESVRNAFSNIASEMTTVGPDIIEGLKNGLSTGVSQVLDKMREIGSKILEVIKTVLGIHSPSTEFFEIGKNIIDGLINGVQYALSGLWNMLTGIGGQIVSVFQSIDWGAILTVAVGAGVFVILYKITNAFETFASAMEAIASPFEGIGKVFDSFSNVLNGFASNLKVQKFKIISEAVKNLAISIAILVGSVVALTLIEPGKLWNAVGVITALSLVLGGLTLALNHFSKEAGLADSVKIGALITSIGASFLMLSVTMKILSSISWEGLVKAGIGLTAFGGIVAGLIAMTALAGSEMDQTAKFVRKIGTAFLLLAVTARILGGMSDEEMTRAGVAVAGFGVVVTALIAVTNLGGKRMGAATKFISQIGKAFLLLAVTAKILGTLSEDDMLKAGICIAAFTEVIIALIAATSLAGSKNIKSLGTVLLSMSGSIAILALTAKLLGSLSPEEMIKSIIAIAAFAGVVAGLVAITKLASDKELAKLGTTLLAMSASIAILAGVAALLGMVKTENLIKGVAAVAALSGLISMMVLATKNAKDVKGTMVGISIAVGVMAASIALLSFIDGSKLAGASLALGVLMGMFALIVKSTANVKASIVTIATLSAVVVLLSTCLYTLAGLPVESTLGTAAALSTLLLALAAACKILDGIKKISSSTLLSVAVLSLVIAALGAILIALDQFNIEPSISTVAAISTLLIAISTACVILSKVGKVSGSALGAIAVLTLVVGGIGAVLGILAYFNVETSLTTALSLSVLLNAMATACLILSKVGKVSVSALGAMAILILVVGGIGAVLGLLSYFNVAPSLETALALSTLLLAMSAAMVVLSLIGPIATGAISGAASMVAVIAIIAAAVAAFGAIAQIPGAEWIVTEGGNFLQKIGTAIGQFVGGIVGGIAQGVTSSLPAIADNLSDFMLRLTPFITGAKMIDPSAMEGIKMLAETILVLTGANILDAIGSFLTGGSSLTNFAEQLVPFGLAIAAYARTVSGMDAEAVTASATAGKALSELANTLPKEGGLAGAIFGETTDLDVFGSQLIAFGVAIKGYSVAIAGMDAEAVTASATAGKALAELANSLPKEGGLAAAIFGETTDLDVFGSQLIAFGVALKGYSLVITGMDTEAVTASASAGKALSELANSLPKEGGLSAAIFGDTTDLAEFGAQLVAFGVAIKAYSNTVKGLDSEAVTASASAGQTLSDLAKNLPKEGGLGAAIFGETTDLDAFGSQLIAFGIAIRGYSNAVKDLDVDSITASVSAGKALSDLANALPSDSGWIGNIFGGQDDLSGFGEKMKSFGAALQEYSDSIADVNLPRVTSATTTISNIANILKDITGLDATALDTLSKIESLGNYLYNYYDKTKDVELTSVNNSITAIKNVASAIRSMEGLDASGITAFTSAVSSLGSLNFKKIEDDFSGAGPKMVAIGENLTSMLSTGLTNKTSSVTTAGKNIVDALLKVVNDRNSTFKTYGLVLMSNLSRGIEDGQSSTTTAISTVFAAAVVKIRSFYSNFYNAGAYLVRGFANGIDENAYIAEAKASAMASLAASAARKALDEHSPSRVFYEIGDYAGKGFVNALDDYRLVSREAGTNMADSARVGLRNAIGKISDLLDSDMDLNPTIRPIVDLSNVRNGVTAINRTLGGVTPVRSIATANSISRSMSTIQNGSIDDVVSAVNKLRKDLGNVGSTTYSINGITYDDGTNVSEAVKSLVRAVKVERRI